MHITPEMIHPELRFAGVLTQTFLPECGEKTFALYNSVINLLKKSKDQEEEKIQVKIRYVSRLDNMGEIKVNVYRRSDSVDAGPLPGVLWLHGGGYSMGVPEQAERFIHYLLKASPCVVIAPDYRLSTVAPYPAAIEDCYATLLWMKDNAELLGIRSNQLMVGGESAGGGLTAALSLLARDRGEVNIAFQMPFYPMLDDRLITESAQDNDAPLCNTVTLVNCWKLYLGDLYGTDKVTPYAAPARADDFSGLPPTCTFVGSIEPFRDEVIHYVEALKANGTPVDFTIFEGCYHGFDGLFPLSSPAKKARVFWTDAFKYAIDHYFAENDRPEVKKISL